MACVYKYKGKEYDRDEFTKILLDMKPSEASKYMPNVKSIPDAPFIGSTSKWAGLAMRRMVRYASEGGFSAISWDTGEVQADRYDLSKKVTIEYNKEGGGKYWVHAKDALNGREVFEKTVVESDLEGIVGKEVAQKIISGEGEKQPISDSLQRIKDRGYSTGVIQKDNSWYIKFENGRDMGTYVSEASAKREAKEIDKYMTETGSTILAGDDLKIGGSGMKAFYDRILPAEVNKFFNKKAWGKAKVGETEIGANTLYRVEKSYGSSGNVAGKEWYRVVDHTGQTLETFWAKSEAQKEVDLLNKNKNLGAKKAWSLPITPEMKSKALSEGMPLYQLGKKPIPDFMADFIKGVEQEKPTKFGDKKDSPPPQDPEGADSWLKDTADTLLKTAVHHLPKNQPHLNWLERLIASPEWYQHKVMQKLVRIFTRNRSELYHQYFNYINETGEQSEVVKTLKDLKHKGLSFAQKIANKSSKEYDFLLKMVDEVDTNWKKDSKDTIEEHYEKVENHFRSKGASDEVINAWLVSRKAYDRALELMKGQMEDMIQKLAPAGIRSDLKEIKFGDTSTKNYGIQYLEDADKFDGYRVVTHKTAVMWGLPYTEGIHYIRGKFKDSTDIGIQAIKFNKEIFDEESASEWWNKNRDNISIRLKESEAERVKELKQTLKGAISLMGDLEGSYAPRQRDPGSWAIQAHKKAPSGKMRTYRQHRGSFLSADRLAKKLRKEGWTVKDPHEFARLPEVVYQDIKSVAVAKALEEASKRMEKGRGIGSDLTMSFNEELLGHVSDLIKARGFRSTMIHRQGEGIVEGYNKDPLERFLMYTNSLSGGLSKARVAEMGTKEILGSWEDGEKVGGIDPATEPRAFEVSTEYLKEQLRNTEPIDRYIGLAKSVATFKYLGFNLRSLGVNLTAIMTTAPGAIHQYALGGKGSLTEIGKELTKAGKDYAWFMAGKKVTDRGYGVEKFLKDMKQRGYDDPQYTREALGNLRQTHQKVWPAMMDASMWAFGKSEEWNRGTTMLAAFRLARKQGIEYEAAVDLAKDASDKAHGVYGKSTLPAWAQGKNPFAKGAQLFYMYSKFGHNYVQMMYDLGMRKHNIKAFTWAALSPLVLAGGAAFPFKDEIFWFFGGILKALGITDSDPEKWVWDQTRRYLGGTGELIARHGLTGAAGVDISGSLSIGIGVPKGLLDLTGAAGGVYKDVRQAGRFIATRQYGRAVEKVIPRGIENPLRALRESKTGLVTQRGKRLFTAKGKPYMPSFGESATRFAGFRSAKEATLAERTWESKREERTYTERKSEIYERYRAYLSNPKRSKGEHKKILKLVQEFNKDIKGKNVARITFKSMKTQAKRIRKPTKREAGRLQ